MPREQLELILPQPDSPATPPRPSPSCRGSRRRHAARWWFDRMRAAVDQAPAWGEGTTTTPGERSLV